MIRVTLQESLENPLEATKDRPGGLGELRPGSSWKGKAACGPAGAGYVPPFHGRVTISH